MHFKQRIGEALKPYHLEIEKKIAASIALFGPKTALSEACAYALKNGGKRFRPALVLMIADYLGHDATESALAIEFFHTASLIADDLPCMDNDDERRECPSLHKAFGQTVALLATYALISAGYDKIRVAAQENPAILSAALENAAQNTGIFGATGGQFLDLYPPALNEKVLFEVLHKKTGTLFELSFVFGWLFGKGDLAKLPLVKKAAAHFGLSFQIVDDFFDYEEDKEKERKINAVAILGHAKAEQVLTHELKELKKTLHQLNLLPKEILEMIGALSESVHQQISSAG